MVRKRSAYANKSLHLVHMITVSDQ
jgi:hypothetical protein